MDRPRMPRIVTAHVELQDGFDFVAEVANLTPFSVFIKTPRTLKFRQRVTVTFFSASISGELAFVSKDPRGVVIVFDAPAELRARIEARIPEVEVIDPDPDGLLDELSASLPPKTQVLGKRSKKKPEAGSQDRVSSSRRKPPSFDVEPKKLAEALMSTGAIPLQPPESPPRRAPRARHEQIDDADQTAPSLTPPPVLGVPRRHSRPTPPPDPIDLVSIEVEPPMSIALDGETTEEESRARARPQGSVLDQQTLLGHHNVFDLPELLDDGSTVVFDSLRQFHAQYLTNLTHGALAVRAKPIEPGAERRLLLLIPGVLEYALDATAVVSSGDTVGFMVGDYARHAEAMLELIESPSRGENPTAPSRSADR
jgi:hypothetical protein